ncbi:MAG: hypothetical protein DYG92_14210 [Leptolyngbya sp. PLA1]|nr:hypothetical protein [Leptolyngbya sp. PLA1]
MPLRQVLCAISSTMVLATAVAQPTEFTDLGRHTDRAESFEVEVHLRFADDIQWFRIELPAVTASAGFVDYGTFLYGPYWMPNELYYPFIVQYDEHGGPIAEAYWNGPNNSVHASYGLTDPRPRPNHNGEEYEAGMPYRGQQGNLSGGVYWLAVGQGFPIHGDGPWNVRANAQSAWESRDTLVRFRVQPPDIPYCDGDFNWDGNTDQDDVWYLANVLAGGENPTGRFADYNRDGNEDQDDLLALVHTIAGGGCPE